MKRIAFYLFLQLFLSVVFSCLAVTMVVWFSQSVRMLTLVINNGGSIGAFLKLMLLLLPSFLPLVLPLSLMVGTLFVYHRLSHESELVVMQAVGLSPSDLAKPALVMGGIVALAGYLLTLVIAPVANHELVRVQYQIRNDHSVLLLRTGVFNDVAKGLTFYARERGKNGDMVGILLHDTRRSDKPVTLMAEHGELVHTAEGPKLLVHDGVRQEVEKATGNLAQLTFVSYLVDLTTLGDTFATRWRDPRERSMAELLNPTGDDNIPPTIARFLAEFHMRLTLPLLAVTFALIACTALLTGAFDRRGMAQKIVVAILVVIGLEAAMLTTIQLVAKNTLLIGLLYMIPLAPIPFLLRRLTWAPAIPPTPSLNTPLPKANGETA